MQNIKMENTQYYSFKIMIPCGYVIPFIYLSADRGEKVYIITPWINVDTILPQMRVVMDNFEINKQITLMEFLKIEVSNEQVYPYRFLLIPGIVLIILAIAVPVASYLRSKKGEKFRLGRV